MFSTSLKSLFLIGVVSNSQVVIRQNGPAKINVSCIFYFLWRSQCTAFPKQKSSDRSHFEHHRRLKRCTRVCLESWSVLVWGVVAFWTASYSVYFVKLFNFTTGCFHCCHSLLKQHPVTLKSTSIKSPTNTSARTI